MASPNSRDQKHGSSGTSLDSKHVSVEIHQEELKGLPEQVRRRVSQSVADLFPPRESLIWLNEGTL